MNEEDKQLIIKILRHNNIPYCGINLKRLSEEVKPTALQANNANIVNNSAKNDDVAQGKGYADPPIEEDEKTALTGILSEFERKLLQNINTKERKARYGRKGISPHLGCRVLESEDPPEYSGGVFSSEDEDNDQSSFCGAPQEVKGHTMMDLFQDAFSRSEAEGYSFPPNKQSGIGYHGRLQ